MEGKDQPIIIVDESRFDLILHAVWLATELRFGVTGLDRLTGLILSLIRDLAGLRFPLPHMSKFEHSGDLAVPGVADRLNLIPRIETICLGDLVENWRALLRPGV